MIEESQALLDMNLAKNSSDLDAQVTSLQADLATSVQQLLLSIDKRCTNQNVRLTMLSRHVQEQNKLIPKQDVASQPRGVKEQEAPDQAATHEGTRDLREGPTIKDGRLDGSLQQRRKKTEKRDRDELSDGWRRQDPWKEALRGDGGGPGDDDAQPQSSNSVSPDGDSDTSKKRTIDRKRWALGDAKLPASFEIFTGMSDDYRVWGDKFIDMCGKRCQGWKQVLNWVLKKYAEPKAFLKLSTLKSMKDLGICGDNRTWLSNELWVFLGKVINKQLYVRRRVLAAQEDDNGFELWRRFNVDHEGGAAIIIRGGRRGFLLFPRCNGVQTLTQHVDNWMLEYAEDGCDLPRTCYTRCFSKYRRPMSRTRYDKSALFNPSELLVNTY